MDEKPLRNRPALAYWMLDQGLFNKDVGDAIGVTGECIRRYKLPFGHPDRSVPQPRIMEKLVAFTKGAVPPSAYYPPHLSEPEQAAELVGDAA